MKKKIIGLLFGIFACSFLVGCGTKKPVFERASPTDRTTDSSLDGFQANSDGVIFVQIKNNGFPQSQGVYDFERGVLTITKQYVFEADNQAAIEQDFAENFSGLTLTEDPLQVYRDKKTATEMTVSKDTITFVSQQDTQPFKKTFHFMNAKSNHVLDENDVEYEIKMN